MPDKNKTVTVIVPHGYRTTEEFLADCQLEQVENPLTVDLMPRPITREVLDEFFAWTRTASMFTSSPEGRVFAEEMRAVLSLAYEALESRNART